MAERIAGAFKWDLQCFKVLKSSSRRSHTVKQFVDGINSADAGTFPLSFNLSEVPNNFGSVKKVMFWQ